MKATFLRFILFDQAFDVVKNFSTLHRYPAPLPGITGAVKSHLIPRILYLDWDFVAALATIKL
jgi:hypothetical protein